MKRSRIKRKPRRNRDGNVLGEYVESHESCANCGATWRTFGCWLEVAHILGGRFGRHDVAANLLRLCNICHHEILIGKQQLGFYLWLKNELGELDRDALQEIIAGCGTSYRLPEPVEPPKAWRRK